MLDIHPQIKGYEDFGPEPSLREMVYEYYQIVYAEDKEEAEKGTKEYFEQLFQQYNADRS